MPGCRRSTTVGCWCCRLWGRWLSTPRPASTGPSHGPQALVGRQVVGCDRVIHTAVRFVAYTKDHGITAVISTRFADATQRAILFRQATGQPLAREAGFADDPTCQPDTRPNAAPGCLRCSRLDRARHARQPTLLRPRRSKTHRGPAPAVQLRVVRACPSRRTRPSPERPCNLARATMFCRDLHRAAMQPAAAQTRAQ
jgi:hypothetical protein